MSVSATSSALKELRRRIITGERAPGDKLKIEELSESLGVGATPVREALSLLTSDRLVERIEQRGFRVAPADPDRFADILRARCWLEERAIRESIAVGDDSWRARVIETHDQLADAERSMSDDPFADGSWESLHKNFHMALIAACGSDTVIRYCGELYDLNVRFRYLAAMTADYRSRDVSAEHEAIKDAAVARDANVAANLLLAHYDTTGQYFAAAG